MNPLDKAKERAKRKDLDVTLGNTFIPTVLSTSNDVLSGIASQMFINMGNTMFEVEKNLDLIKNLEQARLAMYMEGLNRQKQVREEEVLETICPDTKALLDLSSDNEYNIEDLEEVCNIHLASLGKKKKKGISPEMISVKSKVKRKNIYKNKDKT